MINQINEFILSKGYSFKVSASDLDGKYHEERGGDDKVWFIGSVDGEHVTFTFGDWRNSDEKHFFSSRSDIPPEKIEEVKKNVESKKSEQHLLTKSILKKHYTKWKTLESLPPNKYWKRKKLPTYHNELENYPLFFKPGDNFNVSILVCPMVDVSGDLWNAQYIAEDGTKTFQPGGKIEGCFFPIGVSIESLHNYANDEICNPIYVGEGLATCLSFHEVFKKPVLTAFSSSNIKKVIKALLEIGIRKDKIIVLADWDGANRENTGMIEAQKCFEEFGVLTLAPIWDDCELEVSRDFSDLHVEGLLEALTFFPIGEEFFKENNFIAQAKEARRLAKLDKAPPPSQIDPDKIEKPIKLTEKDLAPITIKAFSKDLTTREPLQPLELQYTKTKDPKPICPSEKQVVRYLLKYYGDELVTSEGCLFYWNGRVWIENGLDQTIYRQINFLYQGMAGHYKIEATLKMLEKETPKANRNMFIPNPYVSNFNNGTLRAVRSGGGGEWGLEFGPHSKYDYCTNLVPIDFDVTLGQTNPKFNETIGNLLGGNQERIRALKQMYGACLMPIYPRLFMCIGKPGRGKSTAIILASKLVSEENVSRVAPSDAEGFMLETMIGKLINIDTDIPTDERIPDHFLKKVEDRQPFLVNRKNRKGVMGMLPAVHIYGANDLPPTRERSVGAYDRRWSFNIFDKFDVPMEEHNKDIVEEIVNLGMAGVLNFAVEGLRDVLHNKGKFYQSLEMKTAIKEWQKSNDFVQQFLDDLWSGEFTDNGVALPPKIERTKMWNLFQTYFQECYPSSKSRMGKNKFYEILTVQKGLNIEQVHGGKRCFVRNC